MAKQVLGPNTSVTVNGTDISDHVTSVTINDAREEIDITGFNEDFREFTAGLRDASIDMTLLQDYASSSVDSTLSPLYYNDTGGTVKVNPDTSGTVVYTLAPAKLYGWSPVSGGVGDANTIDVTWRNAGTVGLTRGTA